MKKISRRKALGFALAGAAAFTLPRFFVNVARGADTPPPAGNSPKELIEKFTTDFLANDPLNKLPDFESRIWEAPIFGYASATDPLFEKLKELEIVGPRHRTPSEWLPEAKSVITFFLPFSDKIKQSNRTPGDPSFAWISARCNGEPYKNEVVAKALLEFIEKKFGAKSIYPLTDNKFGSASREKFIPGKPAQAPPPPPQPSTNAPVGGDPYAVAKKRFEPAWSERHAAYIAGLGTFGLNKNLITVKGSAGRLGSLITTLDLDATPRTYKEYYSYCPALVNGGCGACIKRCPPGAIVRGKLKDDVLCSGYTRKTVSDNKEKYKGYDRGCGKCATAVPCESRIPPADLKKIA